MVTLFALALSTPGLAQSVPSTNVPTAVPPPPDPGDEPPYNDAMFLRRFVPSTMVTNSVHEVSVTVQNYGTTVWDPYTGYTLGSLSPQDNWIWGNSRIALRQSVAPGETVTINFQARAPSTPGSYTFQWGMLQEGVAWFGNASMAATVTVREPLNNAAPTGQSATAQMETGKAYNVSVTMYNNGESTWTRAQQYTLMAQSPHNNMTWGLNRVALPFDSVAPGESATFNFQVIAPSVPGSYAFQWGMQREGYGSFGPGTTPITINVVAPPPLVNNAEVVGIAVPARMQTGQRYNISVTMKNSGTKSWAAGTLHRLGAASGYDNMWGLGRVELATPVAPGQQYTFSFQVIAPVPDSYDMQWRMVQDGVEWFGAYAGSQVTVTEDLSRVTFIHTDALGSPIARTDGAGNVISRTRYEPYGYAASGAMPTIGFTGHVNDADTGLTYMQQRYYDPIAGRFLSIDPVVTDANTGSSFNRYSYANNNPYYYFDLDGRSSTPVEDPFVPTPPPPKTITPLIFPPLPGMPPIVSGGTVPFPMPAGPVATVPVVGGKLNAAFEAWKLQEALKQIYSNSWVGKLDSTLSVMLNRIKDRPNEGPPGEWIDGKNGSRKYGPDGKPELDLDKPHQGHERPHVHEWDKNGREHPGRDYSPWPRQ
ncbi:NBR1-Ig-like domain-containing protein [Massilia sp. GCM10023247]|uniref:NBR1-Ig-like domain-containing protein n=1 Tax=Massilia sp. GCM10023247 TaxID=3252643 RepID=UPI00361E80B6